MSFQDDDEVPLLSSPTPFIRNSSLRMTRRLKSNDPPHDQNRPVLRQYVRPPHDRPRPPSGHDRPPLPPPRHSEELSRTNMDKLRKSLSFAHGGDAQNRVVGSVQLQDRPLSPSYVPQYHHDPARKSQSFSYGSHNRTGAWSQNGPISPPPRSNDLFTFTAAGARPLPQDPSQQNHQRLPHLQSTASSLTQRKKTPPAKPLVAQNPTQSSHHRDSSRGICSFLRRPASPSPSRKESTEEASPTHRESSKDSQSSNSGGTTWNFIARIQGRSNTPSPHRAAHQASPTTYRRERHPSDTPPESGFRRYGSLPMTKTEPAPSSSMYLQPRVVSDVAAIRERLSRSYSVRLPRAKPDNDWEYDHRSNSPWRDKIYMQLPQKPQQTGRDSQAKRPQQRSGMSSIPTTINNDTKESIQRRGSTPMSPTGTTCTALSHIQDSVSWEEDQIGSQVSLIPRVQLSKQGRSQSFVSKESEDSLVGICVRYLYFLEL